MLVALRFSWVVLVLWVVEFWWFTVFVVCGMIAFTLLVVCLFVCFLCVCDYSGLLVMYDSLGCLMG